MSDQNLGLANFKYLSLALLVILIMITISFYKSNDATENVEHTLNVKLESLNLLSDIKDAETGQRGFLITSEESYLKPYLDSKVNYSKNLEVVKHLVKDNAQQLSRLTQIDSLATLKFNELERTIELTRADGIIKALQLLDKDTGKAQMQQIRTLINDILREENKILTERNKNSKYWKYGIIALIAISAIILLMSLYNLYQKLKPLVDDLMATKKRLNNVNDNLAESLYDFKKMSKEREDEIKEKERIIAHNKELILNLETQQEMLDKFTHLTSNDLRESFGELIKNIERIETLNKNPSEESKKILNKIRNSVEEMNTSLFDLDNNAA